ncbi:MAG: peptidylprolyl isomerase [Caulobacterales bacterium]
MQRSVVLSLALCAGLAFAGPVVAKPRKPPSAPPAAPAAPTEADWRVPDPQDVLVIDTSKGRIIVEMNDTAAPNSVARIRQLTRAGVYDGRAFFRVVDNFMDQTGDPLDSGVGDSSLPNLAAEFTFKRASDMPVVVVGRIGGTEMAMLGSLPLISQPMDLGLLTADHKVQAYGTYCAGVVGMARSDDPDSANSQFFLTRTNANSPDKGTHGMDAKYTAWGRAIVGQDVIDAIKIGEPVPDPKDTMTKVQVLADMPEATRPKVRVIDVRGAYFKALVDQTRAREPAGVSVCDLLLPVEVK